MFVVLEDAAVSVSQTHFKITDCNTQLSFNLENSRMRVKRKTS